jgi:hypothetical protein
VRGGSADDDPGEHSGRGIDSEGDNDVRTSER